MRARLFNLSSRSGGEALRPMRKNGSEARIRRADGSCVICPRPAGGLFRGGRGAFFLHAPVVGPCRSRTGSLKPCESVEVFLACDVPACPGFSLPFLPSLSSPHHSRRLPGPVPFPCPSRKEIQGPLAVPSPGQRKKPGVRPRGRTGVGPFGVVSRRRRALVSARHGGGEGARAPGSGPRSRP